MKSLLSSRNWARFYCVNAAQLNLEVSTCQYIYFIAEGSVVLIVLVYF